MRCKKTTIFVCLLMVAAAFAAVPMNVSAFNFPPVADAGPDKWSGVGDTVMLSGDAFDSDGDWITTWTWTIDSAPAGSTATITTPIHPAVATITPDLNGEYIISLVVNDGTDDSTPDTATLTVSSNIVVIDFEDAPWYSYIPIDFYASQGVLFTGETGGQAKTWSGWSNSVLIPPHKGATFSIPSAIMGSGGPSTNVYAEFVDPVTGAPATTNFVDIGVSSGPGGDLLSPNVALIAYDSSGNVIATDLPDTTQQYAYLTASVPGISKLLMIAGGTLEIFDDFTYEIPTSNDPPIANAGGPYVEYEGTAIPFDASDSSDPNGDLLEYRWDFDSDGDWDTGWSETPYAEFTWDDEYSGTVTVEVSDSALTATATASVTVNNADPVIQEITSPLDPIPVETPTDVSAPFTDPGILDYHHAEIDWGDGAITEGVVDETGGSGTVTGSHPYTTPGVYQITLTVWDYDGGEASITTEYVVQYDPYGAFVTGGGMIDSPPGAIPDQPDVTGKAGFGFVSKYKKGASIPDGNTQFRFHAGDIAFHSTSYDWLVVGGPRAMFKGTGTVNGDGNKGFLISAIDGDIPGGGGIDRFRIKIWDKATGDIVYDNGLGAPDDADPASPLTHGSIKIHKG